VAATGKVYALGEQAKRTLIQQFIVSATGGRGFV
jgi:hypothetical protein